ncbi:Sugar/inositol transporter [Macrophomina phaseolina MS6]|uniref:Sugar/inositol transporter n=2 Tax=Macrophomina phaseolina TaxID=35725 RepID=K2SDN7_MACPH|nr:Sugar/inositol transporter [Macrophomina phaseolina MS6]
MLKEPPSPFNKNSVILYFCCLVGFCCSTMNGYDGSLLNGLLASDDFKAFFGGSEDGIWAGIVTAMYQIGSVVALPFVGPCIDKFGRKGGMFIGSLTIVVGAIINATTYYTASIGQFEAGRFVLGFGVSIATAAGPMYVVEVTHPAHRGVMTALYNTFWFTGSILAAGAVRGSLDDKAAHSWVIPVWLQILFAGIVVLFVWFLPESPRWLYVNNKREECRRILTKYHGNGDENSVWVNLQLREYEEYLEMDGSDKRWWDYRALFRDRASRYRIACNIVISIFGQWAGNAVLSYYMASLLSSAGYTTEVSKANINLFYSCEQFIIAICGALCVDKLGRRPLLLFSMIGCSMVWVGMTIATSQFDKTESPAASKAATAMIFLFGAVFSFGITPLQALYPVEVLSFEMRAKGMAFSSFSLNAAMLLNQFAWPVSMEKIGWRTYIIFTIWDAIQAVIIYFFIPETKNRTLEELDDIFHQKNPTKASLQKRKVALDEHANVLKVEPVDSESL